MSSRPQSGFRRPQSARSRPAPAAPVPPPAPPAPAAVPEPVPLSIAGGGDGVLEDDDAYWLFSSAYRLTTTDITLAGFTNVALLDAARWRGGEELTPEACAAAELAYTFGFDDAVAPTVTSDHADALVAAIEGCIAGRGGDLLIVFQNAMPEGGAEDTTMHVVARVVDLINRAYAAADAKETPHLAGISVVLEGYARTGLQHLKGRWDDGTEVLQQVLPFTDALPPP
mmetsp:Transcript_11304/g.29015  ORF Transcript_11304/g.29015 Transcript_11304/m.29015 type:complete len:227 (-) Transcript_11304:11-691(-)